jgi:hypothetical protein
MSTLLIKILMMRGVAMALVYLEFFRTHKSEEIQPQSLGHRSFLKRMEDDVQEYKANRALEPSEFRVKVPEITIT